MARLLRVRAPHFIAGAVWREIDGQWQCIRAAPILRWMLGKDSATVAAYLRRKGWAWEWL